MRHGWCVWLSLENWCVDLLESGFNTEDGVGSECYVHEGSDGLYRVWWAAGLVIGLGLCMW